VGLLQPTIGDFIDGGATDSVAGGIRETFGIVGGIRRRTGYTAFLVEQAEDALC